MKLDASKYAVKNIIFRVFRVLKIWPCSVSVKLIKALSEFLPTQDNWQNTTVLETEKKLALSKEFSNLISKVIEKVQLFPSQNQKLL